MAARAVQAGAASLTALLPAELAAQLPAELRRRAWVIAHSVRIPVSATGRLCSTVLSLWHLCNHRIGPYLIFNMSLGTQGVFEALTAYHSLLSARHMQRVVLV